MHEIRAYYGTGTPAYQIADDGWKAAVEALATTKKGNDG
jgi:hypothetical protein